MIYIDSCSLLVFVNAMTLPLVFFQLLVSAGLLQHQHGNHQLLHQSHNPLLCLQEAQKMLQGKPPQRFAIKLC